MVWRSNHSGIGSYFSALTIKTGNQGLVLNGYVDKSKRTHLGVWDLNRNCTLDF